MLSILGSLLGFAGSAVPAITDSFARKADHKHEIEKMKVMAELKASGYDHEMKMYEQQGADKEHDRLIQHDISINKGTGIIAGGPVRAVCEVLGVKDIVAKSMGTSNAHNVIRATMKALLKQNSPKQISNIRNKKISEIIEKRG